MAMQIHFEPHLTHQEAAIDAIVDLFRGQEFAQQEFTVSRTFAAGQLGLPDEDGVGRGNRLLLLDDAIRDNLMEVQLRNGLRPSDALRSMDFTVEMETGTGKTYVYLRTIFKLHQTYGFTKFVIVVPSIAIREGTYKTIQITAEHLRGLHNNLPFSAGNNYFVYDSSKPGQVRNFATSADLQVMVITASAMRARNVVRFYQPSEQTNDEPLINLVKQTRPIVIVDEPQKVDAGPDSAGKRALEDLAPLCTLRYSATHVDKHHMVYRLDPVDAYEQELVKQIEVASATVEDAYNRPYVRLLDTRTRQKTKVEAEVEFDVASTGGAATRTRRWLTSGTDLEQETGRALYRDVSIGEIRSAKGDKFAELRIPGDVQFLRPGEAWNDVDQLGLERQMIRRTVKEHLDKEKRLRPLGIKVLSLFFIPSVDLYRQYDEDGNQVQGDYARIFEEEYERASKHPDYSTLFGEVDLVHDASVVHDGYFSIDRNRRWTDTAESNDNGRQAAERAYSLIMRDKERLLSFETPLKFIFSHSALREGWDNPNVFQICALREMSSDQSRRQTIGRGLRICVDQTGQRRRGFDINTLTVIARERYEDFAANLQKEIEEDTGIQFGIVEPQEFAQVNVLDGDGVPRPLGFDRSKALWERLREAGYIEANGKVNDTLRTALQNDTLDIVADLDADAQKHVASILKHLARRLEVKDGDKRITVRTRRAILDSPEFRELWDRIKHKTTYRVAFDNEALLTLCAKALKESPPIAKSRLQWRKATITQDRGMVGVKEGATDFSPLTGDDSLPLPDILTALQDRTQLTRRSIHRILVESGRLDDFKVNPQQFLEDAGRIIDGRKRTALADGIKYQRIGDGEYYAQELFEQEELLAYLTNTVETTKSVYEQVVFDSAGIEQTFAEDLERNTAVKVYAKLPRWFRVPTPLGDYNPDWAVLVEQDGVQRLYLVVETKGTLDLGDLRDDEATKIRYGTAHFAALAADAPDLRYRVTNSVEDLLARL